MDPKCLVMLCLLILFQSYYLTQSSSISYDNKAIVINGQRRILISGSIHYPISTPQMWEDLILKAKQGGLDVVDTYVFWNAHEPSPGEYNFEGRYDLVRFIKAIQKAGLYAHLRIGPYVCAEWNYGGFPIWLKYVPGITFRTDNEPFKIHRVWRTNLSAQNNKLLALRSRSIMLVPYCKSSYMSFCRMIHKDFGILTDI